MCLDMQFYVSGVLKLTMRQLFFFILVALSDDPGTLSGTNQLCE